MMIGLDDIKQKVDALAEQIGAPANLLPTYGYSQDFAYPHIEVNDAGLHFVVVERGQELKRKTTSNLKELLYWIFSSVTFSMACSYELKNRIEKQDSRRTMFRKQEELLTTLDEDWGQQAAKEHQDILKRYPFDDLASVRASYSASLRTKGYSESEIEELAYKRYPEN